MRNTLSALQKTLHPDGQIVLMGQSKGLAFYEALSLAAAGANLRLSSALYHPRDFWRWPPSRSLGCAGTIA